MKKIILKAKVKKKIHTLYHFLITHFTITYNLEVIYVY